MRAAGLAIRIGGFLLVSAAALLPARATAAVDLFFYSKEFGGGFPHAFVLLDGTLDATGEKIHANYGFTATHISPSILVGSVKGEIMSAEADYVGRSDAHFAVTLSDVEYRTVMETVERWRTARQPSYHLEKRNCVYFVAEVAGSLGMRAEPVKGLMKRPRSFLESLAAANRAWLAARGARFLR